MCSAVRALEIPHAHSSAAPILTISLGCASCAPKASDPPAKLLEDADQALYRAKGEGRNRVR